jgi:hypothetical protein
MLLDALSRYCGNKSQAAKELGLSRPGLRKLLERHHLDDTKSSGDWASGRRSLGIDRNRSLRVSGDALRLR